MVPRRSCFDIARVRGNKGARTAGVDGQTAYAIETGRGAAALLEDLRAELKAQRFEPLPVKERIIPKPGTRKRRRLGIPVVRDRIVQGALKLVLEPIYEADFRAILLRLPPSAEPTTPSPRSACWPPPRMSGRWTATSRHAFNKMSPSRPSRPDAGAAWNRRVLSLVKALPQGRHPHRGWRHRFDHRHPQGGIASPLLANIALSGAEQGAFAARWMTQSSGPNVAATDSRLPTLSGTRMTSWSWWPAPRRTPRPCKTRWQRFSLRWGFGSQRRRPMFVHIDEGLDFFGWRIQRHTKRGTAKSYVYT